MNERNVATVAELQGDADAEALCQLDDAQLVLVGGGIGDVTVH